MLYLLLFRLSGQYRFEKEKAQHKKKNDDFQEYQYPQRTPPCHIPEAIGIKLPYGEKSVFHILSFFGINAKIHKFTKEAKN